MLIKMTVFLKNLTMDILRGDELSIVGSFSVGMAIGERRVVLIGSGSVGILTGEECVIIAMKRPITIGVAHCGSIVSIGGRNGIAIDTLRAGRAFLKKTYVTRLHVGEAVIADLCIIDELKHADVLIFSDPHVYIKELGNVREEKYIYRLAD